MSFFPQVAKLAKGRVLDWCDREYSRSGICLEHRWSGFSSQHPRCSSWALPGGETPEIVGYILPPLPHKKKWKRGRVIIFANIMHHWHILFCLVWELYLSVLGNEPMVSASKMCASHMSHPQSSLASLRYYRSCAT